MGLELLEVATVGLPFCGFKLLAGLAMGGPAGAALVALGLVDAVVNAANLIGLLAWDRRPLPTCSLSFAAGLLRAGTDSLARWRDLGSALDVLLSFALVAGMLGFGRLALLPPAHATLWNACVILNVLGAGLGRLSVSLRGLARAR
ncbi:MAG: hypothetical protein SF051_11205 [Elusimicrobiota bacterium]|nr:hypothetical protein [Elusimicrobiota bacterium]